MTSLLDSTLVGYARSFVPDTLCCNQAIESTLHIEVSDPIIEIKSEKKMGKNGKKWEKMRKKMRRKIRRKIRKTKEKRMLENKKKNQSRRLI